MRVLQIVWLLAALVAARPLQDWAFATPGGTVSQAPTLPFHNINTVSELQQQLGQAQGKITMVDLYADWCVACKEFEKYTFTDPQVRQEFGQFRLVQANVTANSAQDNALLTHLNVLGLPTLLFFDANGHEIPDSRVTGYMNASEFLAHLRKLRAE